VIFINQTKDFIIGNLAYKQKIPQANAQGILSVISE